MRRLLAGVFAAGLLTMIAAVQVGAATGPVPAPGVSAGTSPASVSGAGAGASTKPSGASASQAGASGQTCGGQANAAGNNYSAQPAQAGTTALGSAPSCTASAGAGAGVAGHNHRQISSGALASRSSATTSISGVSANPQSSTVGANANPTRGSAPDEADPSLWPWMVLPIALLILLGALILLFTNKRRSRLHAA
jgi:hypothetical protein